jgi:hypothetical protein
LSAACYINEFRPLDATPTGRSAVEHGELPPFIDASCRREPDLESKYPSITALCREGHFAPRLREGDLVAYMTKDFAYPANTPRSRRLVALLRVHESWRPVEGKPGTVAHQQAAEWYRKQGLPPPRNCMVRGSEPLALEFTDRYKGNLRDWEAHYWKVAREHGVFHACEIMFCDANAPPRLKNQQLAEWFGRIPNTWEISPLAPAAFAKMVHWLALQTPDPARSRLSELAQSLSMPERKAASAEKAVPHQGHSPGNCEPMQTANPAAVAAARAKLRAYEAKYAARPHCTVGCSPLAMTLKSLAGIFEHKNSGNSVVVYFDGRLLTFDCNGLIAVVAATGTAWPARYKLTMAAIADALPIRLMLPKVEVGIWKSMLELDRVRCPGARMVK